jgi:hypothetical protein
VFRQREQGIHTRTGDVTDQVKMGMAKLTDHGIHKGGFLEVFGKGVPGHQVCQVPLGMGTRAFLDAW